jgi:hypothetical protein
MPTEFQPNDKIQHPGKPEWGVGTVLSVQRATHEGAPCQRLSVRFDGAGRKTINTGFAKLTLLSERPEPVPATSPKAGTPRPSPAPAPQPTSQERQPDKTEVAQKLAQLPDLLVDPFRDLDSRLAGTLACYRYRPGDRTLLEWATAQTGLTDPLSILSRHELEEHFTNYRIRLDRHLKGLLDEARRARLDTRPIIAGAPAEAHHALRRVNPGR